MEFALMANAVLQGACLDEADISGAQLDAAVLTGADLLAAQVIIRWYLDNELIVIPKSARADRIQENIGVFDFRLGPEDLDTIAHLDRQNGRVGAHPSTVYF
jgi:diketogulonate reductase-like aldo/keto reductase